MFGSKLIFAEILDLSLLKSIFASFLPQDQDVLLFSASRSSGDDFGVLCVGKIPPIETFKRGGAPELENLCLVEKNYSSFPLPHFLFQETSTCLSSSLDLVLKSESSSIDQQRQERGSRILTLFNSTSNLKLKLLKHLLHSTSISSSNTFL